MHTCAALLLAAGRSERMNGEDKTTINTAGLPLAAHALKIFANCSSIEKIVLLCGSENRTALNLMAEKYGNKKVVAVIEGGKRRQDSVANGILVLHTYGRKPPDLVTIHDVARPLVTLDIIKRGLDLAAVHGAAIASTQINDTIKIIEPNTESNDLMTVKKTLDRTTLRAAQTPQTFKWDLLMQAHSIQNENVTDDAMLIEALNEPVILYDAITTNLKVTTPEDLAVVEAILNVRASSLPPNG